MSVRNVYITKEEFEAYLSQNRLYEGFVIGIGYAYVHTKMTQPPNMHGYRTSMWAKYEVGEFGFIRFQCIDTSPEMVLRSNEAAATGSFILYKVSKGESLWSIANKFGVTADDIARWNGISVTDTIHPDELLAVDDRAKVQQDTGATGDTASGSLSVVVDISLSTASVAIASKLALESYTYLNQLAGSNRFLGMKNGVLTVMDDSFLSTSRMAAVRGAEKAAFLSKVNRLGWLRSMGYIAGGTTSFISLISWARAETTEEKWEYGADTVAGIVGLFGGPWGAFISGNYFLGKAMHPYAVEHEIERADRISRGDYSMAFWKFGRGIR